MRRFSAEYAMRPESVIAEHSLESPVDCLSVFLLTRIGDAPGGGVRPWLEAKCVWLSS
jgi:hypothetical protein